ncbi:MAG: hypothetical protein ACREKJ_14065 [Candidatus Rokuibacteriota bacterium]
MSDDPDLLRHDQLIVELRALCAAQRSGTMFIITTENHAAQFVLRDGEIVGLTYRLLRGPDALAGMKSFTGGRYRFQDETIERTDPRLPATADLLALLIPERAAAMEPPPAQPPTGVEAVPDRVRLLIERELAEFLGPMAALICQEHLAQGANLASPREISRLVETIAKEIGDPAKEARFKQRILPLLRPAE